MSAGKALYGILTAASGVTSLVSTRIYPDMATQQAAYPFIVYSVTNTLPTDSKDGPSGLDEVEFSVLCYSNTYTQAQDIASAVRTALDRTSGSYSGITVQSTRFVDSRSAQMDTDKHVFIVDQSYIMRISR